MGPSDPSGYRPFPGAPPSHSPSPGNAGPGYAPAPTAGPGYAPAPGAPAGAGYGAFPGSAPLAVRTGPPGPGGAPAEKPGFGAGVGALFSGFGFVITNPGVWPWALVPVVILVVIAAIVGFGGYEALSHYLLPLLGKWATAGHGAVRVVAKVLAAALAAGVGLLAGAALAQPLSGPALERIVRRVEKHLGMPAWPETTLAQEIGRSIEGLLLTTALAAPVFVLLFVIDLVFPPAVIVTTPLKIALTALVCAWDLCDYPLSIHGTKIRDRVALLRRHLGAVMGFGLGIALLSLLPCALLFALPAGVAGATKLVARLEAWERREGRGDR